MRNNNIDIFEASTIKNQKKEFICKPKSAILKILDVTSIILLLAGQPTSRSSLPPPRRSWVTCNWCFYFHIGTAWVALVGFCIPIRWPERDQPRSTKDLKWDRIQVAAIEVSLVFFFITIVLGSICGYALPGIPGGPGTRASQPPRSRSWSILLTSCSGNGSITGIARADFGRCICAYRRVERAHYLFCHSFIPHNPSRCDRRFKCRSRGKFSV